MPIRWLIGVAGVNILMGTLREAGRGHGRDSLGDRPVRVEWRFLVHRDRLVANRPGKRGRWSPIRSVF